MNKFSTKAFTLAEVMIVVAILGAVAVMVMPNLKNNTSEDTYIPTLKAAYGQLEAAISSVISDYSSIQDAKSASTDCGSSNEDTCLDNLIANKLDLQLNCETSNLSRCYSSEKLKYIDGNNASSGASYARCGYAFILSNGVAICHISDTTHDYETYEIDVNGPKKGPNVLGIDVFRTYLDVNDDFSYDSNPEGVNARKNGADFRKNRDETAWAMTFGNMEYVKCGADLKWNIKTTCDN